MLEFTLFSHYFQTVIFWWKKDSMAFDYVTVDNLKTNGLSGPSRPTNVLGQLSSSDSNGIHNDKLAQKISPSLALPQNLWVSKKKKKGPWLAFLPRWSFNSQLNQSPSFLFVFWSEINMHYFVFVFNHCVLGAFAWLCIGKCDYRIRCFWATQMHLRLHFRSSISRWDQVPGAFFFFLFSNPFCWLLVLIS